MTYLDKYYDFRAELIKELRQQLLTKEYDMTHIWEDEDERFSLPQELYTEDYSYDVYSLVKYDMEGFKGIGWETEDEYWFDIETLGTETIAHILDML